MVNKHDHGDHDHLACYDGQTRTDILENNAQVVLAEGGTQGEVFFNSIETRLSLPIELRTEEDERLGDAYVNSLANYEAEGEYDGWAPLEIEHLMDHEKVTLLEAAVITFMAAMEYLPRWEPVYGF